MREFFPTAVSHGLFHLLRAAKHHDVAFRPYKYSGQPKRSYRNVKLKTSQ
jgi:hypothetical protein